MPNLSLLYFLDGLPIKQIFELFVLILNHLQHSFFFFFHFSIFVKDWMAVTASMSLRCFVLAEDVFPSPEGEIKQDHAEPNLPKETNTSIFSYSL